MTKAELLEKADSLSLSPGVYLMMDSTHRVIYVGKAKKLRNRVSQYFQETSSHTEKTRAMVAAVDTFDTIVVRSEFEALVLENSLIKRHQPRYNILLKDDKGYPFVRLQNAESYPRFSLVGKPAEDDARYFGPFGGRRETRLAIDAVCAALKLPTCSRRFPRDFGKERPCLNYHIGRCEGWCRGTFSPQEYGDRITQATALFDGKLHQLTQKLQEEMEECAENLAFEKAAALRDRLRALSVLTKEQQVIAGVCADTDVWGVYEGPVRCAAAVLHIEKGNILGRKVQVFPTGAYDSTADILSAVILQYYLDRSVFPREILVPEAFEEMEPLEALLSESVGSKVNIRIPQRGERSHLVTMAAANAREEAERITTETERTDKTLCALKELAGLPGVPHRIESFDISNTGASDIVAGMVVFQEGKPLKRAYRRFALRDLQAPDDYESMRQVLTRRIQRYLDGDPGFTPLPDLLLIDGGESHAIVAEQAVSALGLSLPVLGMVKDDKHRTRALITARGQELGISHQPYLFAFIGRIQEEVHRYAITYHRQKHLKSTYQSKLDGVSGLGEVRRKELMKRFGTIKAVESATLAQLETVVPKAVAAALYEKLHQTAEQ